MLETSYSAARAVAPAVLAHLSDLRRAALSRGESPLTELPSEDVLTDLVAAAFWASLRREEGHVTKISLALAESHHTPHPMLFAHPRPLTTGTLTKLAIAVERPGIHLGIALREGALCIWGTLRDLPRYCPVIEVVEPGLIVIKEHRGNRLSKFVNIAVLEGEQVKIIDQQASSLPDCPELLVSLLGFDTPAAWGDSINVLVQVALSMRGHGRGGLLLVVPADSNGWRESIVEPITYAVAPKWSELAALSRTLGHNGRIHMWREDLSRSIDAVGGLTAVDGATVITREYDVLAFGAKIARRRGSPQVDQAIATEPILGSAAVVINPAELGGTRHLSAAQFVHDQRDAVALVASQDGRFTVFAWSPCEGSVHAHRVEALLL
jgi:hypothetical protein